MDLTDQENIEVKKAEEYIRSNKQALLKAFADPEIYPPDDHPVSLFMAGSPGAGKTEVSKRLVSKFNTKPVRIDADEIRDWLPGYKGFNSYLFQSACTIGIDKLHDYVLENGQNFILDGTFASPKSEENVRRSLDRKRKVEIYYIYQPPEVAWEFTKIREAQEGRKVSRDVFVESLLGARENVNNIKKNFEALIELNIMIKNFRTSLESLDLNIQTVDDYLPEIYTKDRLNGIIQP